MLSPPARCKAPRAAHRIAVPGQLMQRRQAVSALASLLAAAAFGNACAQTAPLRKALVPDRTVGGSTIDIHCHVFNARDLPIPGFVTDLYLNELPKIAEVPAGATIWFLSYVMDAAA